MAAELIMPTLPGDQQQSRHFLPPQRPMHQRSQSYHVSGPQISPISSTEVSPNQTYSTPPSPRGQHARPGRPMYMPAVLRPCDEFPSKRIARTKTGGSTSDSDSDSTLRRANSNLMSLAGLSGLGNKLSRRSTGESTQPLDGDWNIDSFPEVTAPPTRKHWKVKTLTAAVSVSCHSPSLTQYRHSPMPSRPSAMTRLASAPSAISSAGTTAANAVTSSATGTRAMSYRSTRTQTSTPKRLSLAHATTAFRS
ncbi:Zn finger protein [Purpureocillium takamizusanense]|uniref:Zn finger protein n=1 Tax=Purpureocillium takamizusanense TaxID=2060973 RepID=A0A9Q8Q8K5_9HYPO|nr:Zn finger protein [Purpureocillium takamizusanense]UNI14431.1 Zn finger protein [Purpureocillium takamizusanense]